MQRSTRKSQQTENKSDQIKSTVDLVRFLQLERWRITLSSLVRFFEYAKNKTSWFVETRSECNLSLNSASVMISITRTCRCWVRKAATSRSSRRSRITRASSGSTRSWKPLTAWWSPAETSASRSQPRRSSSRRRWWSVAVTAPGSRSFVPRRCSRVWLKSRGRRGPSRRTSPMPFSTGRTVSCWVEKPLRASFHSRYRPNQSTSFCYSWTRNSALTYY